MKKKKKEEESEQTGFAFLKGRVQHMCVGVTHSARSPGARQVCLNANITRIFCVFF